ncbi:PcfJ domain-containing protein [Agrobacterium salinitolerans]|nr:PcfJ domain-containing protein [Agrobacterium salinitolerans]
MYKRQYLNDPSVIEALVRKGPSALFDFLLPDDLVDFPASSSREKFVERTVYLFGPQLRIDELCSRIIDLARDARGHVQFQFVSMVYHLWVMDNRPVEAVALLDHSRFDGDVIRRLHDLDLMRDPLYVANSFVNRLRFRHRFQDNSALTPLVIASIGRIALKESRKDLNWFRNQDPEAADHVVDWIESAINRGAPWLSNVNDKGIPKKLMKFGSLESMCAAADKEMKRLLVNERQKMGLEDEEDFADEGGEFYIVHMKTPAALDNESNAMRHCVGHGAYDRRLSENGSLMLSLRDRKGWPHMTIEVANGSVVQARGKANSQPKQVHAAAAHRLLDIRDFNGRASSYLLKFVDGPV